MSENLWILTEEKPKISVIRKIIKLYEQDFSGIIEDESTIKIKPKIKVKSKNDVFKFHYIVEGIKLSGINKIFIKIVSGNSSFMDFLVFKQESKPNKDDIPIMAIEETKTSDEESRNTGVYQRASKFAFVKAFYKNINFYMLYNDELNTNELKKPSDTSIFGTNMLLTLDVKIIGKDTTKWFKKFKSIDDVINFKSNMRRPPAGNVPIDIIKYEDKIEVSGRLAKPSNAGNIGHDPNIGALSLIGNVLRYLGWRKKIVITKHGVAQDYIDKTKGKNKFLYICSLLDMELDEIEMPLQIKLPEKYWRYEKSSEKVASILLHIVGEYYGMKEVYQNHAGCERGYFKTKNNELITLPKKDKNGYNLYIPDLILYDENTKIILLIEGKKISTLNIGLQEINNYDSIENEFIKKYYPDCTIYRYLSIFGGDIECWNSSFYLSDIFNKYVLLHLDDSGNIMLNDNSPDCVFNAFYSI